MVEYLNNGMLGDEITFYGNVLTMPYIFENFADHSAEADINNFNIQPLSI